MSKEASTQPNLLSDRSFGLIFAAIFLVISLYPLIFGGQLRTWAIVIAACWATPAMLIPRVLHPLNIAWMHFGKFMHSIINPILMGLVFFVAVVPTGLILKLLGKDPMRRKLLPDTDTYWQSREQQPSKDNFTDQF